MSTLDVFSEVKLDAIARQLLNQCKIGVLGQNRVHKLIEDVKERDDGSLMDVLTFQNDDGWTALMHACNTNAEPLVRLLLENGATHCVSVAISDAYPITAGYSALHFAALKCPSSSMLTLLCEYGADVNIQTTTSGDTPLHIVARRMTEQPKHAALETCAAVLLLYGAYPDIRNIREETPVSICPRINDIECDESEKPTFLVDDPPVYPPIEDVQDPLSEHPTEHRQSLQKRPSTLDYFVNSGRTISHKSVSPTLGPRPSPGYFTQKRKHSSSDTLMLRGRTPPPPPRLRSGKRESRVKSLEKALKKSQEKAENFFEKYQQEKMETNSLTFRINSLTHALEEERSQRVSLEAEMAKIKLENSRLREELGQAKQKLEGHLLRESISGSRFSHASQSSSNEIDMNHTAPTSVEDEDSDERRFVCNVKWPRPKGRFTFKKDKYVRAYTIVDDNGFECVNIENSQDTFTRIWNQVSTIKVDGFTVLVSLDTSDRVKMNFDDRQTMEDFQRIFTNHFSVAQSLGGLF